MRPRPTTPAGWRAWLRSRDGYEREEATVRVIGFDDPADLPELIERVNDWVPQVRDAAERGLRWALRDDRLTGWLVALDSVAALSQRSRTSHRRLLDAFEDFIARPEHLDMAVAAAPGLPVPAQRFIGRLEMRPGRPPDAREASLRRIVSGSDALLAVEAFRQIRDMTDLPARERLIDVAMQARWSSVRMPATVEWLKQVPPVTDVQLIELASNRSRAVRTVAWYEIRQRGIESIAVDEFERRLGEDLSTRSRVVLLEALADVAFARASSMLQAASRSPSTAMRKMAFTALLKGTKGPALEPLVLLALSDSAPRVRAAAVLHVARGRDAPPLDRILLATSALGTIAGVRHAATMAMAASLWPAVHSLLTMLAMPWPDGGHDVIVTALDRMRDRVDRAFTQPDAELAAAITAAWVAASPRLPEASRRKLAFALERGGLQLSR